MKAYSTDLRERVVAACDARVGTREQIAARFSVSVAWVRKLLRLRRDTGSLDPKPHGGGRLRAVVRADPDAGGVPGPRPAGRHPEKKTRRAAEQDRPELKAERASWREEFAAIDPARLVFIDESGASTAMDRAHGGVRVDGPVPHGHWKVITLTAAIRLGGVPGELRTSTRSWQVNSRALRTTATR